MTSGMGKQETRRPRPLLMNLRLFGIMWALDVASWLLRDTDPGAMHLVKGMALYYAAESKADGGI